MRGAENGLILCKIQLPAQKLRFKGSTMNIKGVMAIFLTPPQIDKKSSFFQSFKASSEHKNLKKKFRFLYKSCSVLQFGVCLKYKCKCFNSSCSKRGRENPFQPLPPTKTVKRATALSRAQRVNGPK